MHCKSDDKIILSSANDSVHNVARNTRSCEPLPSSLAPLHASEHINKIAEELHESDGTDMVFAC